MKDHIVELETNKVRAGIMIFGVPDEQATEALAVIVAGVRRAIELAPHVGCPADQVKVKMEPDPVPEEEPAPTAPRVDGDRMTLESMEALVRSMELPKGTRLLQDGTDLKLRHGAMGSSVLCFVAEDRIEAADRPDHPIEVASVELVFSHKPEQIKDRILHAACQVLRAVEKREEDRPLAPPEGTPPTTDETPTPNPETPDPEPGE